MDNETSGTDGAGATGAGERTIEANRGRLLQDRKAKKNGLTKARREAFLRELAATCNVSRAIAASGKAGSSIYRKRRRDPEFAAQWQAALEVGYARLEAALVRRALEVVDGFEVIEDEQPVEKMTVAQAIDVMDKHRRSVAGGAAKSVRPQARHVATEEETDRAILKRIAILKRQREGTSGPGAAGGSGGSGGA